MPIMEASLFMGEWEYIIKKASYRCLSFPEKCMNIIEFIIHF